MDQYRPLVSVVLPVFNGERFVKDAIISIQKQTLSDWELIIVDDGSTDLSFDICQEFSQQDQRIKVFRNSVNQGLARSMNTLISCAIGKYIAIQEHDDISVPERLLTEVEILELHPKIGCVSGIAEWLDDDEQVFAYFPKLLKNGGQYPQDCFEMVKYLFIEQCKVVNAACMYCSSAVADISGPYDVNARLSVDWQFFLHFAHKHRIFGIPKVLVKMRRGNNHQSLTKMKTLQFQQAHRCLDVIYEDYRRNNNSPINYWLYRKAKASELVLEGRFYGRLKGLLKFASAIYSNPGYRKAWFNVFDLFRRGIGKLLPLRSRPAHF